MLEMLAARAENDIIDMKHISLARGYKITDMDKKYIEAYMLSHDEYKDLAQKRK